MRSTKEFEAAYQTLNKEQKEAVDAVEGPVLVIAGPGTGKTHILTLRIANILKKTEATPANILALTFTESAARTIRERLGRLIGEQTAREVNVFTFHSFCNYVLETYSDYFPEWKGKRQAGAVESTLLWREVLETNEVVLLRTPKSAFHSLRDLESLYGSLIRERITLDEYRAWPVAEEARIRADESLTYVRDSTYGKKGELKPDGKKKIERLEKVYEAAKLIEAYEMLKQERDVYDFNDVLRGVVDMLHQSEDLRLTLSEKFQYVLADEHQDANAYQHALLDAFAYDDHPNLFVVGDEKQAIYRFQGADASQFSEFVAKYPRTALIHLTESRRALQEILDIGHTLAVEKIPATHEAHEPLIAHREGTGAVSLLVAPDALAERDQIATLIEEAIKVGTEPQEIAVITAKNASANLMSEHLMGRGIPTLRAGDIRLDARPFMRAFFALLRAVGNPLDTNALREALLAAWWDMDLFERAGFLLRTRNHELLLKLKIAFPKYETVIRKLQKAAGSEAPLQVFSRTLFESGAQSFVLSHPEHLEDVALVRKLYEYFEQAIMRNPKGSFAETVEAIARAHEHGLEWVQTSVLQKQGLVTVITAHKAKGMEFEKVFIIGLTENEWERGRSSSIPSPVDFISSAEDAVKKFYVAITRAKNEIVLSYGAETLEGRERKPSSLIPDGLPLIAPVAENLPRLHHDVDAPELVRSLTHEYLEGSGLFPTALEDYLNSPPTFFARRVLHLREPEQPSMLIGNAVHAGIAGYIKYADEERAQTELERALYTSLLPRDEVYESAVADARARLTAFLKDAGTLGTPEESEKIYSTRRRFGNDEILLAGKLDAIYVKDGKRRIIDFKTSKTIKGKEKDFELQLAYYDMLLRANDIVPAGASIVQVRTDGIEEFPVVIDDQARDTLSATLEEVVPEMLSSKWRAPKEPGEYDDLLKLFV